MDESECVCVCILSEFEKCLFGGESISSESDGEFFSVRE